MPDSLRGYRIALASVWAILCIAGVVYAHLQDIPAQIALAVIPAFLIETGLYLSAGTGAVRARLARLPRERLAVGMVFSALIPYCVYSIATGVFRLEAFVALVSLASVASFWYLIFRPRPAADMIFLVVMAAPIVGRTFRWIYPEVGPRLGLSALGVLMWYRVGISAILLLRRMEGIGFGFLPRRPEWLIGIRNFLFFLPVGLLLAVAINFVRPEPVSFSMKTVAVAIATFAGALWVLAAGEEFFFRGLLQQLLTKRIGNQAIAIGLASLIFGLAHLGYRAFPNWKFALLATVAGVFYGRAYAEAGSIRAAMVTHALVVVTWKVFLN
jgi:membrane protease YdiL (CAAX protease family)